MAAAWVHPLIESGILLASIASVLLNLFFNGAKAASEEDMREAAMAGGQHCRRGAAPLPPSPLPVPHLTPPSDRRAP